MNNLDSNASGAARPDQVRDNGAPEPNPGLSAAMPDVQFVNNRSGGMEASDFARTDPLIAGHMRRSPGDRGSDDVDHRAFFEKQAAEVGEASLGPGILETPLAASPTHKPVRASDFVRERSTGPNNSRYDVREPISPEQAFGLSDERLRADNLQHGQPSAMSGNPFPTTAGRTDEDRPQGDNAQHQVVRVDVDHAPVEGPNQWPTITKHEIVKEMSDE